MKSVTLKKEFDFDVEFRILCDECYKSLEVITKVNNLDLITIYVKPCNCKTKE